MVGHKTEEKLVRAVNLTGTALAGCCECDEVLSLFIGVHPQSPGIPEGLHLLSLAFPPNAPLLLPLTPPFPPSPVVEPSSLC